MAPVFYTYDDTESEKKDFVETLYHDRRNGQMIYLRKSTNGELTQKSTCAMEEVLKATGTDSASYYTSVNTFRGSKRSAECVYNITAIFIDLDCHVDDPEQIRTAKDRAVKILEAAYSAGELAVPTMITDTGRGFGLQYVLTTSIAVQTMRTAKTRNLFQKVRQSLFDRYKKVLSVDPVAAQPDAAVLDDARVCRLPGTYNDKAGTYCRLIGMSRRYFELRDIVQECHLWTWKSDDDYKAANAEKERKEKERRAQLASKKIVPFNSICMPFLENRIHQLEKIQDIRGKACTDSCREQILFIAYSALVQIDRLTAVERLQALNARFTDPLPQKELNTLIKGTDSNETSSYKGYYLLKNSYIEQKLELTEEEVKAIGLNVSAKKTADRQAARNRKKKKKDKVIALLKHVDHLTYEEIAEAAGVSRRTVCSIAKEEGQMRYGKAAGRDAKRTEAQVISINSAKAGVETIAPAKSAKIAPKYVCGGESESESESESFDWFVWLSSLCPLASIGPVATELLALFELCSFIPPRVGRDVEVFFDMKFAEPVDETSLLSVCNQLADLFFKCLGIAELSYVFGTFLSSTDVPMLWKLYKSALPKPERARIARKERSHLKAEALKTWAVSDYRTETPEHRKGRLDCLLQYHTDKRFTLLKSSPEYQHRIDADVLRLVEITFMELKRVHSKKTFSVDHATVSVADIKKCFKDLSHEDIAVICERLDADGTVLTIENAFFFIIAWVWRSAHS